jgi:type II secretory pathway predicted ATPase ExeA
MYESFFHMKQRPFAAAPRIDRYFPGSAIEAARQALARSIDRAEGAALLVGPAGTGKTLVCHLLAEQFRGRFAIALLSNGHLDTRRELLQAILFELGLPYRRLEEGELRLSLIDYISNEQNARDGLLLIVDEAHTLPARLLEEIRLIANLVRNGQSRVRLVLAGNPSLEETLADPQLEALSQRVATRCYLDGLDHAQSQHYVLAQMTAVDGDGRQVFTSDALEAVYRATDGIPRLINQVCDHALMLAFAGGRRQIGRAGIEEAWSDLQQLPAPWGEPHKLAATGPAEASGMIEFGDLDDEPRLDVGQSPLEEQFFAAPGEIGAAAEATLLMHQIDDHLAELAKDFTVSVSSDQVEPPAPSAVNPFDEHFDEEEVLLDRYSSIEPGSLPGLHQVESDEGRTLAALLETFVRSSLPELGVVAGPVVEEAELLVTSTVVEQGWFESTTVDSHGVPSACGVSSIEPSLLGQADEDTEADAHDIDWRQPAAVPLVRSMPQTFDDDEDLMIVEDDPRAEIRVHSAPPARRVRRQEFRQLFSSLRRG